MEVLNLIYMVCETIVISSFKKTIVIFIASYLHKLRTLD